MRMPRLQSPSVSQLLPLGRTSSHGWWYGKRTRAYRLLTRASGTPPLFCHNRGCPAYSPFLASEFRIPNLINMNMRELRSVFPTDKLKFEALSRYFETMTVIDSDTPH